MKNQEYMKKIVNFIDKSLEFSNCLLDDSDDSRFVLKVYKKGVPYVLKGVHVNSPLFLNMNHEKRVLYHAGLRNLKKINIMLRDYYNHKYNAVLKNYYEGVHLKETNEGLIKILKRIVTDAHKKGFSNLDLRSDNIIVNAFRNDLRLIDFETDCRLRWNSKRDYEEGVMCDFDNLRKIEFN